MTIRAAKRAAKQLDPPSIEEDAAERKRQLNVLAQRRYRRRKREHLQRLEQSAVVHGTISPTSTCAANVIVENTSAKDYTVDDFSAVQITSSDWPDFDEEIINLNDSSGDTCLNSSIVNEYDLTFDFMLPPLSSSPTSSTSTGTSLSSASSPSQSDKQFMPRDEIHLPMLQLTLLRGMMTIAKRLDLDHLVFDISARSPFCLPNDTALSHYSRFPPNLRPTATQLSTPHHPALDLIPWPDVRDKLIMVFSQPTDVRPLNARSPTAFVEFVYDFEDSAEGARIWGDDPTNESNWEVGEKIYNRWWWALTGKVVIQANTWRKMRGARLLGDSVD